MLLDLNKSIDGNAVAHVFSALPMGVESQVVQFGRVKAVKIQSETGRTGSIVKSKKSSQLIDGDTIFLQHGKKTRCIGTPLQLPIPEDRLENLAESWCTCLSFAATEGNLRTPQSGALHALLAHWSKSTEPATIVLPTGTGKN